ncbi:MAG: SDR family oxidoreductase [Candidatus Humimicrobiaceae bacterium]
MDLVIGATGHSGNALVRQLLNRGQKVRVLLRKSSDNSCLDSLPLEKSYGDILNLNSLITAAKNIEHVYHMAAEISIMPGDEKRLEQVNLEGTRNVVKACKINDVRRLIFTSSIHALRDTPIGTLIDEKIDFDPCNPRGAYDRTKAKASLEIKKAAEDSLDAIILCPTAFIGPYDYKVSLLGQFFIDYLKGNLKFIIDGAYDYIDVRDVAAAHILAAEKARKGTTYILSSNRVDMDSLLKMLNEITGIPEPRYKLPNSLASIASHFTTLYYYLSRAKPQFTRYSLATIRSNSYICCERAQKELGFKARPFKESLRDTLQWYKKFIG